MDLKKLSPGERIMAATAVLLVLDLFVLPWHRVSVGLGAFEITSSRTGVESPNGLLGLLAALLALAVLARIVLAEFTSVALPVLPVSWERADLLAGAGVAGLVLLKLVLETTALSVGAWLAVILAGGMAYGGYVRSREARPGTEAVPAGSPEPTAS